MSLTNNLSAGFLRFGALLCLSAGFLLAIMPSQNANANKISDTSFHYSKSNFNASPVQGKKAQRKKAQRKKVQRKKVRRVKTSYTKARKTLRKTKTNSLVRRKPNHRSTSRSVRRYRGLHPRLSRLLSMVKRHYGRPVSVTSGCRSHRHNRRIGGAKRSMHLRCMAADFRVAGVSKARLRRYVLRLPGVGGVGTYCGRSIIHLDVGPRRSWAHGCRKRRRKG